VNSKPKFATKAIIRAISSALVLFASLSAAFHVAAQSISNLLSQAETAYVHQDYTKAVKLSSKAIKMNTNECLAYSARGLAYMGERQYDKARRDIDMAVKKATNDFLLYYAYTSKAALCEQATNHQQALREFGKAIQINPKYPVAYAYRARTYNSLGSYDLAIIDCNMAILFDSDLAIAYITKGDAYLSIHELDKAINAYTKGIALDTNSTTAYYWRACAYSEKENYTNAIADFSRYIKLDPTFANSYSSRGLLLSRIGDFNEGIKDCQKAIQIDSNDPNALNNLAWLLATAPDSKLRNGKKAVKYATRANELSAGTNAYCLGTLAAALAEVGQFDEAIKWEEKCIQVGLPNEREMVQARKELGLFYQKKPYHADN
jgi:tetratricopeptide (TPR) repeat protein